MNSLNPHESTALPGRPSLSAPRVHSPQLKVRVPVKLKAVLELEAQRRGETTSTLIREALEKYLANVSIH